MVEQSPKPPRQRQKPTDSPVTLQLVPLEPSQVEPRSAGRPRKKPMPPLPNFQMNELEQQWFDWIIDSYLHEFPDLTDTDKMQLPLLAIEYIKYLRVAAFELESGQTLTMARMHPFTNLKGLMEQLAVTRKAKKSDKTSQPDPQEEARAQLLKMLS